MQMQEHKRSGRRFTSALSFLLTPACLFCLLCLLTSCGQGSSPNPHTTVGSTATAQGTERNTPTPIVSKATPAPSTSPVVSTQTNCPVSGTAHAMVTAPLTSGTHQTIVYVLNEGPLTNPTLAVLRRYDVTTGVKTDILSLPNVSIAHAQLSFDRQWILFTATDKLGGMKLQAVRVDGQELQTLYCTTAPGLDSLQWSPTQKFVAFTSGGPGNAEKSVYLLNVVTGALQVETSLTVAQTTVVVRTWPDNTHIYLTDQPVNGHFSKLYLLDTNKGPNQPFGSLAIVAQGTFHDFDSTSDGSQLFLTAGGCSEGSCPSPDTINAMPITGGVSHSIFTSSTRTVLQVRAISGNTLLLIVHSSSSGESGLWMMNSDGTRMVHLNTDDAYHWSSLNVSSQYTSSNVSNDGNMYALLRGQPGGGNTEYTLLYGNLGGGTATVFADAPDGNTMMPQIVGWTTL